MNAANRLVLTDLIQRINAYLPQIDFGPANPNTDQMHHDFVMGAENSRFVDVKIHKSYLHQWTAQDWQMLGNFLSLLGQELYADLARVLEEDAHDYVFRFWWDEATDCVTPPVRGTGPTLVVVTSDAWPVPRTCGSVVTLLTNQASEKTNEPFFCRHLPQYRPLCE